jgi:CBS domain-containing protein
LRGQAPGKEGKLMAELASLMATEMITARPDESVAEVAQRMSGNGVGAVLVLDGEELYGLFSERDLLGRVITPKRDPTKTRVGDVTTRDVVTIDARQSVKAVLAVFRERRFRHLPVVQSGKPVGILSTRDFLEYLVDGFERFIDDLKYKRELEEGLDPYDHFGGSYGR